MAFTTNDLDGDVWVYDLSSKTLSRVSTDTHSRRPEWTPDGKQVAYITRDSASNTCVVKRQPWDGSGEAEGYIASKVNLLEVAFPRHGDLIAIRGGSNNTRNILLARVDSPNALYPFLATPAVEESPAFSPDGSLLAYTSDESGRLEVYVRPVPGPGARVRVSKDGGTEPLWSPDGKELFFRGGGQFMAATIKRGAEVTVEGRVTLFPDIFGRDPDHASYDVFPDGSSFVMVQREVTQTAMMAVVNSTQELQRKAMKRARN